MSAGLSPLPVEEKAAIGLRVRLQLPFLPACRERGRLKDLACAYNGLFRLPVEEKAIMRLACRGQDYFSTRQVCFGPHRLRDFAPLSRPQCWSAAARRINTFRARRARNFDYFRLLKSVDLSRVENTKKWGGSGHEMFMDSACACDDLFPLPVKGKAVLWTWCAFAMAFPPCLSRKRPSRGLGVRLRWAFPLGTMCHIVSTRQVH